MAGFGQALDLSGILDRYDLFRSKDETEAMRNVQEPDEGLKYANPVRMGLGPLFWSTSTVLVPRVQVCYDVNGYYRELGVDCRASRKELREAYQALDGQASARLTYVFKQLLDSETRKAYDEVPLGEPFLDDYTQADLRRRAHKEAGRRADIGKRITAEDVLDEWGYVFLPESQEGVDSVTANRDDVPRRKAKADWGYSYYAWQTRSYLMDSTQLQEWQTLLSSVSAEHEGSSRIAIGITSMEGLSDDSFMIENVVGTPVIFFSSEAEPSREVARKALSDFLTSTHSTQFPSQQGDLP